MRRRLEPEVQVLALCAAVAAAVVATLGHAASARHAASRAPAALEPGALVRAVGFSDLALSSGARWLRHPTQVEPWAAVTDEPGTLDVEPAGALLHPRAGSRP